MGFDGSSLEFQAFAQNLNVKMHLSPHFRQRNHVVQQKFHGIFETKNTFYMQKVVTVFHGFVTVFKNRDKTVTKAILCIRVRERSTFWNSDKTVILGAVTVFHGFVTVFEFPLFLQNVACF